MKFQFSLTLIVVFLSITTSFCQTYPGTLLNIAGGSFTMGNNNPPPMFNDQDPEHDVTVDDFKMGETEVPNAYYVVFLNDMASLGNLIIEEGIPGDWSSTPEEIANGHAWSIMADSTLLGLWAGEVLIKLSDIAGGGQHPLNRCWIELDTTSYTFSVVEGYENWPASWVSWYGAMMYADYYGVNLPTEAEWEKACCWNEERQEKTIFPWGDEEPKETQANLLESHLWAQTEIGSYPDGKSPAGCQQMMGDVWEWTSSEFTGYPGFKTGFDEYNDKWFTNQKVLRGGSFGTPKMSIRGSYRNFFRLDERWLFSGFRCVEDI